MTRFDPLHAVTHIFINNPKLFELQSHQTVLKARCLVVVAKAGLVEGVDSLDAAVNVGGSIAGVGSDAGGVGKSNRWLSLTLVDLADGGDGEGGGNALVGSSTGSLDVSVGGISGISKGRLSLSLTLVDLAHSGDGEGGGNALVRSGTGSPGVGGVSVGSVSVSKGRLSLSITLAKVVAVSVTTIGMGQVSVSVTSIVGAIGIGGNSVGSVEEGWIGISSSDSSAGSEGNNGLLMKRK